MSLAANIKSPNDLWAVITNCFYTSSYKAHGFFHWGYSPKPSAQINDQALETLARTVWGHFSGLMAWYELETMKDPASLATLGIQGPNWVADPNWLSAWAQIQQKNYFEVENINTRRYKNPNINFRVFFQWLQDLTQDATQEVYDWYPAQRPGGWRAKLGPAKLFPGLLVIDAKGNAPNQFKPKGPLLQYTYNAGTKNAITNSIMIAKNHEVVKDYAQYKATPGWRGQPYDLNQMWSQGSAKIPYQDWIDELESNNRSRNWMMYSDAKSPIFSKFTSVMVKKQQTTIPTINYEYRYYDFL